MEDVLLGWWWPFAWSAAETAAAAHNLRHEEMRRRAGFRPDALMMGRLVSCTEQSMGALCRAALCAEPSRPLCTHPQHGVRLLVP